jgi:SAM-dependent methyltransferase
MATSVFDSAYYKRFYLNPHTAVASPVEIRARAQLIAACMRYLDLPVRRILDAGAGTGDLRRPLLRSFKGARYVGLEVSDYLCKRYGWQRGSIADLRTRRRFDLVVCYDVFQYVDDAGARRGIRNLAHACRGALYFGALTEEDWKHNCDRAATDWTPWVRPGSWYRRELGRSFTSLGCGMWVHNQAKVALWDLDKA